MVDVEKVKKGLDICALRSAGDCTSCPYFENTYCNDLLASDAAEYIESLEERLAIMQESMETLEKRCNALEALEQRCKALEVLEKRNEPMPPRVSRTIMGMFAVCGNCSKKIVNLDRTELNTAMLLHRYCSKCGQEVKWK